jgi:hypothetical protein
MSKKRSKVENLVSQLIENELEFQLSPSLRKGKIRVIPRGSFRKKIGMDQLEDYIVRSGSSRVSPGGSSTFNIEKFLSQKSARHLAPRGPHTTIFYWVKQN